MIFAMNSYTTPICFLPKRSALQQLILFTEKLLDGKNEVDVIYVNGF